MTASPHIEKTKVAAEPVGPRTRLRWPDVLRAVPADEARSYVGQRLREAGYSPDLFATVRPAREAVAKALTSVEDRQELGGVSYDRRAAIRVVRRRLELELWP